MRVGPAEQAADLLARGYERVGYDALAAIARVHARHRDRPSVEIYE